MICVDDKFKPITPPCYYELVETSDLGSFLAELNLSELQQLASMVVLSIVIAFIFKSIYRLIMNR